MGEQFTVTNSAGACRTCEMRVLGPQDKADVLQFQKAELSLIEDPDLIVALSNAEIEYALGEKALAYGIFTDGKMVAFDCVIYPGGRPDNLGLDLGYTAERLLATAHYEFALTARAYRGCGLHKKVGERLTHAAFESGHRDILSTVAPHNIGSIAAHLALGYQGVLLRFKYGGKRRLIFRWHPEGTTTLAGWETVAFDQCDILGERLDAGFRLAGMCPEGFLLGCPE